MTKLTAVAGSAVIALALGASVSAQTSVDGSIRGHVRDEQKALLPGVTITATSANAPGTHTAVSDGEGYYRLLDLPPGDYMVTAQLQGFSKFVQEHVLVRAGLNLGLDVTLTVGNVSETVTVKAETPLLESRSAVQAMNVSGDFQRSVPLAGRRDWADFMLLTPGVVNQDVAVGPSYYLHGADFSSNVFEVDGVEATSVAQSFNRYFAVSTDAIQDVQVKTGAVDASSPLGLGAVINVVTVSGTNEPRGAAGVQFQPERWNGDNTSQGTSTIVQLFQSDVSFGGPIERDHSWLFGSYRRMDRSVGITRTASTLALLEQLAPGFQPFNNDTKANDWFVKGTGQFAANQQVNLFYQYDATPNDANGITYAGKYQRNVQGGHGVGVRWSATLGHSVTLRANASYNNKNVWFYVARNDMPGRQVFTSTVLSAGQRLGSGLVATLDNYPGNGNGEPNHKTTASADATYYRKAWIGSHELQAGVYFQRFLLRSTFTYANGGFVIEDDVLRDPSKPATGLIPFHRRIYGASDAPNRYLTMHNSAVYAQDAWRPTSRLTINAGVRIDSVHNTDDLFGVSTQQSVDVGPRIGANYLVTSDGLNTVRASWVRVHDLLQQNIVTAGSSTRSVRDLYDVNLDGVFETEFITPAATALAADRMFDLDHFHQPYLNETTVGYRHQFPGRLAVGSNLIRREYRDRGAGVEINGIYDGGVFSGYRNPALNQIYLVTNNTWNWPVYTALELEATKQTSRIQFIASYTRQFQHLAGGWQPNDPASFIQPNAFPIDHGIGQVRTPPGTGNDANSLSGTSQTQALQWRDHQFRAGGSWNGPGGLLLAMNFMIESGLWSGPIITRIAAPDLQFGPSTIVLSNGRLVSNPLATTFRFAYPTRGDGQFTTDPIKIWNVRIGRRTKIANRELQASLDFFNALNGSTDQLPLSGANQTFNSNYGQASTRQLPRSAQVSLRFVF